MMRFILFLLTCLPVCCFSQTTTFSDYFATADDYALSQLSYELEGKTDTLLGRCVDSILVGSIQAAHDLSQRVLDYDNRQPLGYLFRGLAEADLERPAAAFASLDTALALAPELVVAYLFKGSLHVAREEYDLAEETYRLAASRNPLSPQPPYLLGALEMRENHGVRARKLWEESVAIDSCYTPARIAILRQRIGVGRVKLGVREVQELTDCDELSAPVHHLLGLIAYEQEDYEQALYRMNTAVGLRPENESMLRFRSKVRCAREEYEAGLLDLYHAYAAHTAALPDEARTGNELNSWRKEMVYALNYFRFQGQFAADLRPAYSAYLLHIAGGNTTEVERWEKQLRSAGQGTHPGFLYFRILAIRRNWLNNEDTAPLIDRALAADPRIVDLYRLRGQALLWAKDYRAAFSAFQTMGELEPQSIASLKGMALVLLASERPASAVSVYQRVLTIDSTDTDALGALGDYYYTDAQYGKALTYYDKFLERWPRHATVLHRRATCYYLLGKSAESLEDLRLLPPPYYQANNEVYNLRGLVYMSLDSLDQAAGDFNTAIANDKKLMDAYLNRARLNLKRQRYDTALRELDYVAHRLPDNPFVYANRALAKAYLGEASACEDLRRATELGYLPSPEDRERCCPAAPPAKR